MANIALLVRCEVQEPHRQPSPRSSRGDYDVPCYKNRQISSESYIGTNNSW